MCKLFKRIDHDKDMLDIEAMMKNCGTGIKDDLRELVLKDYRKGIISKEKLMFNYKVYDKEYTFIQKVRLV